ncbi:MAG: hypothetical protein IT329_05165 [Caldilineaceae bacterium]|nr:hypothetical protein [Caldilineaceae bacterium]
MLRRFPNSRRVILGCIAAVLCASSQLGWSHTPALAAPEAPVVRAPDRRLTRERPLPSSRRSGAETPGSRAGRPGPPAVRHSPR